VGTNWSAPTDWQTVYRRAYGRRRYNAMRRFLADQRRNQLLTLVIKLGGLQRGAQTKIAQALGVHRSTISKGLKRVMPLAKICGECGSLLPRLWVEDE
jgi:hypothetical protein